MRAPSASNLGVFRVDLVWNMRLGTEERSKGFWDPQPFHGARDAAVNGVGWRNGVGWCGPVAGAFLK